MAKLLKSNTYKFKLINNFDDFKKVYLNKKNTKDINNFIEKKVTKPKAKKMPEKLKLPANAQLKYNLLCNTGGSNKFYQIYVAVKSGIKNSSGEFYKYDIYTGHGRVGAVPVIGIHYTGIDDLKYANSRAQAMADAKIKKGYKAQAISGFKAIEEDIKTNVVSKKRGRKSKSEVEQQIKIDKGTGRFSLINLD